MAKTTSVDIRAQIKLLEEQARALEAEEVKGVIGRIRDAIAHYRLTPADLFGEAVPRANGTRVRVPNTRARSAIRGMAPAPKLGKVPPKYRDEQGNVWTGRGSQPKWLAAAIASGRKLEDFVI